MGNYAVPEEIRKMRPAGTTVKNIKGHFYVYEYTPTSVKIKAEDGTVNWKSKTKSGPCIGYITLEDGFVRNAGKLGNSSITVFEYGAYFLIRELAVETMRQLKDCFNAKEANQILQGYDGSTTAEAYASASLSSSGSSVSMQFSFTSTVQ